MAKSGAGAGRLAHGLVARGGAGPVGSVGVTQADLWGQHVPDKREKRFAYTDDTGGGGRGSRKH